MEWIICVLVAFLCIIFGAYSYAIWENREYHNGGDSMITSTIIWHENLDEAPTTEKLLVWVKDDSGNPSNEYTTVGWKVDGADNIWIIDNNQCDVSWIRMWAKMPE